MPVKRRSCEIENLLVEDWRRVVDGFGAVTVGRDEDESKVQNLKSKVELRGSDAQTRCLYGRAGMIFDN
jgi:hypothetical protein